jgi:Pvc16 N-terminal domain
VIHEVDEVLQSWVLGETLDGADVEVVFDAPTSEWAARRNAPTVNLFLYDIREDVARRHHGLIADYDDQGMVLGEHEPPRWFRLSYLVTAWTTRSQDEHRLLSTLLAGFLRHDVLPPERLSGSLADLGLPVPVTVALPPGEDRALADVWTALGGELKASLDLVVTAPVAAMRFAVGPPVTDGMRLRMDGRAVAGREALPVAETRRLRYGGPAEPSPAGVRTDAPAVGVRRRRTRTSPSGPSGRQDRE